MPRRDPQVGTFPHIFRGQLEILVSDLEWRLNLKFGREANPVLVRYATAPTQTPLWLRYRVRYAQGVPTDVARWQCPARIVHSKIVGVDGYGTFFAHRLTFALFGDEEVALDA